MKKQFNILFILLLVLTCFISVIPVSYAEEAETSEVVASEYYNNTENVGDDFCAEPSIKKVLRFFGLLILLLKLAVPAIIIAKGTFIFYNAVIKGESKDLSKSFKDFAGKILLGLTVFFIPSLLNAILGIYNDWATVEAEYTDCATCLLDPSNCE